MNDFSIFCFRPPPHHINQYGMAFWLDIMLTSYAWDIGLTDLNVYYVNYNDKILYITVDQQETVLAQTNNRELCEHGLVMIKQLRKGQ